MTEARHAKVSRLRPPALKTTGLVYRNGQQNGVDRRKRSYMTPEEISRKINHIYWGVELIAFVQLITLVIVCVKIL